MGETGTLERIPIAKIAIHPANPRRDVGDISELAASIKDQGLVEPIVVTAKNGSYLAVIGARRLAAARKAGLADIPAIVRELSDAEAAAAALIENLQRKDLNPLEEAEAYRKLLDVTAWSQRELAQRIGRAQPTIANALRLLEAPKPVKEKLAAGEIPPAHALTAMQLKDPGLVSKLKFGEGVTTKELRERVHEINDDYERTGPPAQEKARLFLEKVKKDHPGFTITWKADDKYRWKVSLRKALGAPPKKILGRIYDTKKHDKICKCRALELEAADTYGQEIARFEINPVCIDRAGYKKPHGYAPSATRDPKAPSRKEREAEIAKDAREHIASVHRYHDYSAKQNALHAKLAKHGEVDRLVLMALADFMRAPSYTFHSWQAIAKFSLVQVRQRIRLLGTQKVIRGASSYGSKKVDRGMEAIFAHFKVDPGELGYEVAAKKAQKK